MFTRSKTTIILLLSLCWSFAVTAQLAQELTPIDVDQYRQTNVLPDLPPRSVTGHPAFSESTIQDNNTTLIGRWANGPCNAVASRGDTVYLGNGAYLEIVDFTAQNNPVRLGKVLLPNIPINIIVIGDYAYVADGRGGLHIYDISNPIDLKLISAINSQGSTNGVVVNENIAYIADGSAGIRIIDVSNPSNPEELAKFDLDGSAEKVAIDGNRLYVAAGSAGLRIIDVSEFDKLYELGALNTDDSAVDIQVQDEIAYVADYKEGLKIIDVGDPTNPVELSDWSPWGNSEIYGITKQGDYLYVVGGSDGIRILNVSNPSNPSQVGITWGGAGVWQRIAIHDTIAYAAVGRAGLKVIDVSILNSPRISYTYETGDETNDIAIDNNYAYVSNGGGGLRILDISRLDSPVEVGRYKFSYARGVVAENGVVYVLDRLKGLCILDASDPSNPKELSVMDTEGSPYGITIKGDIAYIADHLTGLFIIDVSNPADPILINSYDPIGYPVSIEVRGQFAYVGTSGNGLRIIDITDPANPTETGYPDRAADLAIMSHFLFMADYSDGLRILDITNPTNPKEIGSFNTGGSARGVAIEDKYAYIADDNAGLRIIDVTRPDSLYEIGFFQTAGNASKVLVNKGIAFLADGTDGVYIIQNLLWTPPPPIEVLVGETTGYPRDTVTIPIHFVLPPDSTYNSIELVISEFQNGLNFIDIDTTNTITGEAGWAYVFNETDSLILNWSAGAEAISDSGVYARLQFEVIGEPDTFVPVTIKSAVFNTGEDTVVIRNGGIWIKKPILYGDVNADNQVTEADVRYLLEMLVGSHPITDIDSTVADVSNDGTFTSMDASLIMQYLSGEMEGLPYRPDESEFAATGQVSLASDTVVSESDFMLPVYLKNPENIYAFSGMIDYEPSQLTFQDSVNWTFDSNLGITAINQDKKSGSLVVAVAMEVPLGQASLLGNIRFYFHELTEDTATHVTIPQWQWNEDTIQTTVSMALIYPQPVGVMDETTIPDKYTLQQNYPNPFNPTTTLRYGLPQNAYVQFIIYDLAGRKVKMLVQEQQSAGWYQVQWNGTNDLGQSVSTGVYFYRLEVGDFVDVKKVVYMK
ncbi:MAG: T9SS type A sorting domain-containing protein [Candidatus Marinimicrobia bacterium]|nr:T9SS type A sorting domain-containing protein [Candidatus Neomarinimicrobiota bacterium]MCF7828392.1 T9SS type A sorting domain-containing protein [Candidatus Neomarinimicrobiota bacterium]MCF7881014.1 T9SS type A sorting domain-containing protein [Candidatus Neomarinimicrobiota bacterium]